MRIAVLDGYTLNPGDLSWDSLGELGSIEVFDRTPPEKVVARSRGAEIILTNKTPITRETMEALPELRYIGVLATGYNIVDVAAARDRRIVVTNIPTYGTASVAQFAFALLLELCHRTQRHADAVRNGEWQASPDWSFWKTPLIELSGKTMGVVGFGRIGRQTARIADAMEMRVVAYDTLRSNAPPYEGFRWAELNELLAEADVVSLHCPLTPETQNLMNRERLRLMKRTAFLLNTSRGPLIVEQDLADALNGGEIAGAALDVIPVEPPRQASPLFAAKNCLVTPHIAWATREARDRLMTTAVENVRAFLAGRPQNAVS